MVVPVHSACVLYTALSSFILLLHGLLSWDSMSALLRLKFNYQGAPSDHKYLPLASAHKVS